MCVCVCVCVCVFRDGGQSLNLDSYAPIMRSSTTTTNNNNSTTTTTTTPATTTQSGSRLFPSQGWTDSGPPSVSAHAQHRGSWDFSLISAPVLGGDLLCDWRRGGRDPLERESHHHCAIDRPLPAVRSQGWVRQMKGVLYFSKGGDASKWIWTELGTGAAPNMIGPCAGGNEAQSAID